MSTMLVLVVAGFVVVMSLMEMPLARVSWPALVLGAGSYVAFTYLVTWWNASRDLARLMRPGPARPTRGPAMLAVATQIYMVLALAALMLAGWGAWIEESPQAQDPRQAYVGALAEAEKYDQVLALVREWLEKPPTTTAPAQAAGPSEFIRWCRTTVVRTLLLQQKYAEAVRQADAYIKLDPKNAELMNVKASCLSETGRSQEAMAVLEKVIELEPDHPGYNNNLGYTYADRGIHLEKADSMVRKALLRQAQLRLSGEGAFLDSLGWVYYKQGRFREAGGIFQRIVRAWEQEPAGRSEQHPVIFDHAGDVYYRLGWKARAVGYWTKAVELAKEEKRPGAEGRKILSDTPAKIEAVRSNREPALAPLGQETKDKPTD